MSLSDLGNAQQLGGSQFAYVLSQISGRSLAEQNEAIPSTGEPLDFSTASKVLVPEPTEGSSAVSLAYANANYGGGSSNQSLNEINVAHPLNGVLNLQGYPVLVAGPQSNQQCANKVYVDTNIQTEAAARISADNTLQDNLDTETNQRESADQGLQDNIDQLSDQVWKRYPLYNDKNISTYNAATIDTLVSGTGAPLNIINNNFPLSGTLNLTAAPVLVGTPLLSSQAATKQYTDQLVISEASARTQADNDLQAEIDAVEARSLNEINAAHPLTNNLDFSGSSFKVRVANPSLPLDVVNKFSLDSAIANRVPSNRIAATGDPTSQRQIYQGGEFMDIQGVTKQELDIQKMTSHVPIRYSEAFPITNLHQLSTVEQVAVVQSNIEQEALDRASADQGILATPLNEWNAGFNGDLNLQNNSIINLYTPLIAPDDNTATNAIYVRGAIANQALSTTIQINAMGAQAQGYTDTEINKISLSSVLAPSFNVSMAGQRLTNLDPEVVDDNDAAPAGWVLAQITSGTSASLAQINQAFPSTGQSLDLSTCSSVKVPSAVANNDAINLGQQTTTLSNYYTKTQADGTFYPNTYTLSNILPPSNSINMANQWITNLKTPSAAQDATTKQYVDGKIYSVIQSSDNQSSVTANTGSQGIALRANGNSIGRIFQAIGQTGFTPMVIQATDKLQFISDEGSTSFTSGSGDTTNGVYIASSTDNPSQFCWDQLVVGSGTNRQGLTLSSGHTAQNLSYNAISSNTTGNTQSLTVTPETSAVAAGGGNQLLMYGDSVSGTFPIQVLFNKRTGRSGTQSNALANEFLTKGLADTLYSGQPVSQSLATINTNTPSTGQSLDLTATSQTLVPLVATSNNYSDTRACALGTVNTVVLNQTTVNNTQTSTNNFLTNRTLQSQNQANPGSGTLSLTTQSQVLLPTTSSASNSAATKLYVDNAVSGGGAGAVLYSAGLTQNLAGNNFKLTGLIGGSASADSATFGQLTSVQQTAQNNLDTAIAGLSLSNLQTLPSSAIQGNGQIARNFADGTLGNDLVTLDQMNAQISAEVDVEQARAENAELLLQQQVTAIQNANANLSLSNLPALATAIINCNNQKLSQVAPATETDQGVNLGQLNGAIDTVELLVQAESIRAQTEEAKLNTAIQDETTRATGAEQNLQDQIDGIETPTQIVATNSKVLCSTNQVTLSFGDNTDDVIYTRTSAQGGASHRTETWLGHTHIENLTVNTGTTQSERQFNTIGSSTALLPFYIVHTPSTTNIGTDNTATTQIQFNPSNAIPIQGTARVGLNYTQSSVNTNEFVTRGALALSNLATSIQVNSSCLQFTGAVTTAFPVNSTSDASYSTQDQLINVRALGLLLPKQWYFNLQRTVGGTNTWRWDYPAGSTLTLTLTKGDATTFPITTGFATWQNSTATQACLQFSFPSPNNYQLVPLGFIEPPAALGVSGNNTNTVSWSSQTFYPAVAPYAGIQVFASKNNLTNANTIIWQQMNFMLIEA